MLLNHTPKHEYKSTVKKLKPNILPMTTSNNSMPEEN